MKTLWRKPTEIWHKVADIAEPVRILGALLWRAGPFLMVVYYLLELLLALAPIVQLIAIRYIVDGMMLLQTDGEQALRNIIFWIGIFILKLVIEALADSLGEWSMQTLGERSRVLINNELLDAIDAEDTLKFYEEPEYRGRLETLRDSSQWLPNNLLRFPVIFFANVISMAGVFFLIADLSIWLAALLFLCFIPYVSKQNKFRLVSWDEQYLLAPVRRKMTYSRNMVLSPDAVKEVKLFQNGSYFEQQYQEAFQKLYQQVETTQQKGARDIAFTGLFSGAIVGAGYLWIVWEAIQGNLSPGNVALFLTAIYELANYAKEAAWTSSLALEVWQMGKDYTVFLQQNTGERTVEAQAETMPIEIKLEQVSFAYPQSKESVLEDINLTISPGEKVAIVGENGSGKTTLVKLLCHFYEPTTGKVLLNGKEANRAQGDHISVVFQDFGRYAFPISTNIALGKANAPENLADIKQSAVFAGIHNDITLLPEEYQTMLGREWGGHQLSGGQWQKIAIARSYYRKAQLLILDEPTASLDIRSEYKIYDRFSEYTEGKTTIIISHRFSTVKMADRIIVLRNGRMIETGSHDKLMEVDGEYAEMYRKQAALFNLKEGESLEGIS